MDISNALHFVKVQHDAHINPKDSNDESREVFGVWNSRKSDDHIGEIIPVDRTTVDRPAFFVTKTGYHVGGPVVNSTTSLPYGSLILDISDTTNIKLGRFISTTPADAKDGGVALGMLAVYQPILGTGFYNAPGGLHFQSTARWLPAAPWAVKTWPRPDDDPSMATLRAQYARTMWTHARNRLAIVTEAVRRSWMETWDNVVTEHADTNEYGELTRPRLGYAVKTRLLYEVGLTEGQRQSLPEEMRNDTLFSSKVERVTYPYFTEDAKEVGAPDMDRVNNLGRQQYPDKWATEVSLAESTPFVHSL